ncbi:MAG: tetratricopeptide repeat protein [Candidatus Omnitrophota bacterium]
MVKRIFLLLVMLLFLFTLSYATDMFSYKAEDYYASALKSQQQKKITDAKTQYQKAVLLGMKDDKHKKIAYNNLAVIYANEGNFVKAEEFLNEALKIAPDYKTAKLNLGLVYDQSKSQQEAMDYWMKVLDLNKLKPKEFIKYSDVDEEFLKDCTSELCKKVVFNNEGVDAAGKGELDKAEELFKSALEIDPACDIAKLNLGLVYDIKRTGSDNLDYWMKVFDVSLEVVKPKSFIIDK